MVKLKRILISERFGYSQLVEETFTRFKMVCSELGFDVTYLPIKDRERAVELAQMISGFKISFEEGVRVLLQIWSERSSVWKKRRFGSGLPVRIWSLTGRASREWLAEYIQKTYPDREHEKASNLPIPILKSIRGTDSWEDFLQAYKINVNKQRRKLYYSTQAKKSAAHRFRKSALNAL